MELSFAKLMCYNDVLVNFLIKRPTADKIKQTGTTCVEKRVQ